MTNVKYKIFIKKSSSFGKGNYVDWAVMVQYQKKNIYGNQIEEAWSFYDNKKDAEYAAKKLKENIKRKDPRTLMILNI